MAIRATRWTASRATAVSSFAALPFGIFEACGFLTERAAKGHCGAMHRAHTIARNLYGRRLVRMPRLQALLFLAATLIWTSWSLPTSAQTRCDCAPSARTGQCRAQISRSGKTITVRSNSPRCSMVTWFADGEPKVTTVTDGRMSEPWLGRGKPKLEVDACFICTDRKFAAAKPEKSGSATAFSGRWEGTAKNAVTTVQAGFVLQANGDKLSGYYFQEGQGNETVSSSSISGNTLKMRTGPISWVLTLSGSGTMTGKWRNLVFSGPITVRKVQ